MIKLYTLIILFSLSTIAFGNVKFSGSGEENLIAAPAIGSEADLSIYPNPVKSYATIAYTSYVDRIVIMNIVGKEVRSIVPEDDNTEVRINLTDLQPGVYFIAAYSNGAKLITKRFMKEQ
jgi:hypothetical protein